ncbi:MAG: TetR/AcrR family transcriptional regulator [Anaerolineaceae bacterium]|nr:TetR/AcrR family transcriptional regulator [Anaerolineaceae bacterium]
MDNRTRLLNCALELFTTRGYDAVGVQEIVESAGVTKPSLYHYFNSKRGLLDALLKEHFEEFNAEVRQAACYEHDPTWTLEKLALVYFSFAQKQPEFYRMQLSMQFSSPDCEPCQAVLPYILEQYGLLEDLFAQAALDHGNMRGRQRAYAATFLGMLNTYIAMFLNGYTELGQTLVYQATHQFMHGIFS